MRISRGNQKPTDLSKDLVKCHVTSPFYQNIHVSLLRLTARLFLKPS